GCLCYFFFSSRRRHTRFSRDWSSDVCSSDLAAELGGFAGDGQIGVDEDGGDAVGFGEAAGDDGFGGAVAAVLPAAALEDRDALVAVLGDDLDDALVGQADRAELDLDAAVVVVALAGGDGGAGDAGGEAFEVEQHRPGLVGGDGDGEGVLQLHVTSPGR